jgi:hypothetical protein
MPTRSSHVTLMSVLTSAADASPPTSPVHFALKPLGFSKINPQSILIQKSFFSILFSFSLAPVLLKNSTRGPTHAKIQF